MRLRRTKLQPLKLIRTREPYIDLEPVSAAPLKPGDVEDFRLIFDAVSPDWNSALSGDPHRSRRREVARCRFTR